MTQREIKFRAWDKAWKKILTVDMLRIIGNTTYQQIGCLLDGKEYLRDVEEVKLMQFTGLHDKQHHKQP